MERVSGRDTQYFHHQHEREELTSIPTELTISIRPPSKREIVNSIKAMKNGKAA